MAPNSLTATAQALLVETYAPEWGCIESALTLSAVAALLGVCWDRRPAWICAFACWAAFAQWLHAPVVSTPSAMPIVTEMSLPSPLAAQMPIIRAMLAGDEAARASGVDSSLSWSANGYSADGTAPPSKYGNSVMLRFNLGGIEAAFNGSRSVLRPFFEAPHSNSTHKHTHTHTHTHTHARTHARTPARTHNTRTHTRAHRPSVTRM